MKQVNTLSRGNLGQERVNVKGVYEINQLNRAFNRMLDRIESERLDYGRRTLAAQEEERRRVARELHDEIGQTLTALMLQLGSTARHAPTGIKESLADATATPRRMDGERRDVGLIDHEPHPAVGHDVAVHPDHARFLDRQQCRVQLVELVPGLVTELAEEGREVEGFLQQCLRAEGVRRK